MRKFLVMVVAAGLSLNVVAADFQTEATLKTTTTLSKVSQDELAHQVSQMEARAGMLAHDVGGGVVVKNGSAVSSSSRGSAGVSHSSGYSKGVSHSKSHGSSRATQAQNVPYATKTRCVKKVSGDVTEEVCQIAAISMEEATALIETEAQMNRSLSQARIK